MTAPAKKTPARKRATSASVAARREVRTDTKAADLPSFKVTFRGEKFDIPLDKLGNGRVYLRQQAMAQFSGPEEVSALLFEILGKRDSARFINLMGEADNVWEAASDFFKALRSAANVPNS